jgi:hypothetical protein
MESGRRPLRFQCESWKRVDDLNIRSLELSSSGFHSCNRYLGLDTSRARSGGSEERDTFFLSEVFKNKSRRSTVRVISTVRVRTGTVDVSTKDTRSGIDRFAFPEVE